MSSGVTAVSKRYVRVPLPIPEVRRNPLRLRRYRPQPSPVCEEGFIRVPRKTGLRLHNETQHPP